MQWHLFLLLLPGCLLFRLCPAHTRPLPCAYLCIAENRSIAVFIIIFFPIFSPPLSPSAFPVSVVVTFWQISEINVCIYSCMHVCGSACALQAFCRFSLNVAVNWSRSVYAIWAQQQRFLISLAQLMVMSAKMHKRNLI